MTKIKPLDYQIVDILDQDAVATKIEALDDRNFEFEIFLTKIKAALAKTKTSVGASTISKASGGAKGPHFAKFPKLEIKPFFGNPLEYASFSQ